MKKIKFLSTLLLVAGSFFATLPTAHAENGGTQLVYSKYKECINGNKQSCQVAEDIRAIRYSTLIKELNVLIQIRDDLISYTPDPNCDWYDCGTPPDCRWLGCSPLPPICELIDCNFPPICDPRNCDPIDFSKFGLKDLTLKEATINLIEDLELNIESVKRIDKLPITNFLKR